LIRKLSLVLRELLDELFDRTASTCDGIISLVDKSCDVVLTGRDLLRDFTFEREDEVSRVVGTSVEDDLEHFSRISIATVVIGVSVDPNRTNECSRMSSVYGEEVTHSFDVYNRGGNHVNHEVVIYIVSIVFLRFRVLRIRNETDSGIGVLKSIFFELLNDIRVEESVTRVCNAYGVKRVDVYATTSNVIVSVENAEGQLFTQTRRILQTGTDIERLDRLNSLVRGMTAKKLSL
jgi:hypothetical protein